MKTPPKFLKEWYLLQPGREQELEAYQNKLKMKQALSNIKKKFVSLPPTKKDVEFLSSCGITWETK